MKVGDMVRFAAGNCSSVGVVIAVLPADRILARAVSVVWSSGEVTERSSAHILEVISESR
jgi:peroxiredoxin